MNVLMLGTFILTLAIGLTVIFWPWNAVTATWNLDHRVSADSFRISNDNLPRMWHVDRFGPSLVRSVQADGSLRPKPLPERVCPRTRHVCWLQSHNSWDCAVVTSVARWEVGNRGPHWSCNR